MAIGRIDRPHGVRYQRRVMTMHLAAFANRRRRTTTAAGLRTRV
jgi:hypothetical protein